MKRGVKNILRVLDRASKTDIEEGRVGYFRYRTVCSSIAEYYNTPINRVIAVVAALSPNCSYFSNLRSAVTVINAFNRGYPEHLVKVASYNHCRDRAFSYLRGVDFLDTVKGKKIRSFYQNILNPLDPFPVTIDGHALNIWRNERRQLKNSLIKPSLYDTIAEDYRETALRVSLLPNQVQCITWFAWKWTNRIIATDMQLELYQDRSNDLWKTIYYPEDLKPYKLLKGDKIYE